MILSELTQNSKQKQGQVSKKAKRQKDGRPITRLLILYYSFLETVKYFYLFHTIFAVLYKFRLWFLSISASCAKHVFRVSYAQENKEVKTSKTPDEVGLGELHWGSGKRHSNTRGSHLRDMREPQMKMFEKWLQEWRNGDSWKKERSQDVRYEKFREVSPDCANGWCSQGLLLFSDRKRDQFRGTSFFWLKYL